MSTAASPHTIRDRVLLIPMERRPPANIGRGVISTARPSWTCGGISPGCTHDVRTTTRASRRAVA